MVKRNSIRLKATVRYLLRVSAVVLPIIIFCAFIAVVSNFIVFKGLFAFYTVETFLVYIYIIFNIYMDEQVLSQTIMDKLEAGKNQEYNSIMFHQDGDFKLVIPHKNIELMKLMPRKFVFLNESDWSNLYKVLISKYNNEEKPYLIYFDSESANILMLRKYYLKKGDRYYLV